MLLLATTGWKAKVLAEWITRHETPTFGSRPCSCRLIQGSRERLGSVVRLAGPTRQCDRIPGGGVDKGPSARQQQHLAEIMHEGALLLSSSVRHAVADQTLLRWLVPPSWCHRRASCAVCPVCPSKEDTGRELISAYAACLSDATPFFCLFLSTDDKAATKCTWTPTEALAAASCAVRLQFPLPRVAKGFGGAFQRLSSMLLRPHIR